MVLSTNPWRIVIGLTVALLATLQVYPHYGPPEFRDTGVDKSVHVWHFGWPLSNWIYDPRFGWQESPTGALWIMFDVALLVLLCLWLFWQFLVRYRD